MDKNMKVHFEYLNHVNKKMLQNTLSLNYNNGHCVYVNRCVTVVNILGVSSSVVGPVS